MITHRPDWMEALANRLRQPLPAWEAHRQAAPPHSYGRQKGPCLANTKQAAVMLLLCRPSLPASSPWIVPLTLRPLSLSHGGQVSLPGGRIEADESPWQAACREVAEELGVASPPRLLGKLSPLFVFVSDHWVETCVAVLDEPTHFQPCPDEVAEIIHLPLDNLPLLALTSRAISRGKFSFPTPGYLIDDKFVWGATAMILAEFASILHTSIATPPLSRAHQTSPLNRIGSP